MSDEKKRGLIKYFSVMLLCTAINIGLYWAAHSLNLPMWLDTVGTAAAAVILEPAAGLVIGYLTNLFESSAVYMSDTIIYYSITASCAVIFGALLRKEGKISWKRLPAAALIYVAAASVLSAAVSVWRGALPSSEWELLIYKNALSAGISGFFARVLSAAALKLVDTAVMCAVVPLLYAVLPESMKNTVHFSSVTWKSPFERDGE